MIHVIAFVCSITIFERFYICNFQRWLDLLRHAWLCLMEGLSRFEHANLQHRLDLLLRDWLGGLENVDGVHQAAEGVEVVVNLEVRRLQVRLDVRLHVRRVGKHNLQGDA